MGTCPPPSRLDAKRVVTNRPLAGTRKRGTTPEEDKALEAELMQGVCVGGEDADGMCVCVGGERV